MRLSPRHSAAALLALAAVGACRGVFTRGPAGGPERVRVVMDTVRSDTAAADTAFPMMPAPTRRAADRGPLVRVLLAAPAPSATLTATTRWTIVSRDGTNLTAGDASERWSASIRQGQIRLERASDGFSFVTPAPVALRTLDAAGFVGFGGRRYRGEIIVSADGANLVVVNRLAVEDYLLGVVPLEIGNRAPQELAAVEAQAIAARSYAHTHRARNASWDVRATIDDQVYGGVDVERPLTSRAVEETAGQVLYFGGRIADAPYHSTCGGTTAEPGEVWNGEGGAVYLRRVSDRIPGTNRFYCDQAPRFEWSREIVGDSVGVLVERYLRSRGRAASIGRVRDVRVASRTASGRVGVLAIDGARGDATLRGNEIRYALRGPGGELLNSTYFSVDVDGSGQGGVRRLVMRGHGYGHGIGMCQWGAIGRARAGQDALTILRTYYPGTSVAIVQ